MANNKSIQILRGNSSAIASSNETLLPGQLLYNTSKRYLTVGGGGTSGTEEVPVTSAPIVVRELIGYSGDTDDAIGADTSELYSIKYEYNEMTGNALTYTADTQKMITESSHGGGAILQLDAGSGSLKCNLGLRGFYTDYNGYTEVSGSSVLLDASDSIQCKVNNSTINFPSKSGTVALTSDIPTYYRHCITMYINLILGNRYNVAFDLFLSSSTPLTSIDEVFAVITLDAIYPASGAVKNSDGITPTQSIKFSGNGGVFTPYVVSCGYLNTSGESDTFTINVSQSTFTITDSVVPI